MIADFGLSRIMDDEKLELLTEICGTPGVRYLLSTLLPSLIVCTVHGP